MEKFCGHCGSPLDPDARVCGQCGRVIEGQAGQVSINKIKSESHTVAKVKKGLILLAVLLLVIGGAKLASGFMGKKAFTHKVMKKYQKADIEGLYNLGTDLNAYEGRNNVEKTLRRSMDASLDYFGPLMNYDYRTKYRISTIDPMPTVMERELLEEISYDYPAYDLYQLKDFTVARVTLIAKNKRRTEEKNLSIYIVKERGKWRLLYMK